MGAARAATPSSSSLPVVVGRGRLWSAGSPSRRQAVWRRSACGPRRRGLLGGGTVAELGGRPGDLLGWPCPIALHRTSPPAVGGCCSGPRPDPQRRLTATRVSSASGRPHRPNRDVVPPAAPGVPRDPGLGNVLVATLTRPAEAAPRPASPRRLAQLDPLRPRLLPPLPSGGTSATVAVSAGLPTGHRQVTLPPLGPWVIVASTPSPSWRGRSPRRLIGCGGTSGSIATGRHPGPRRPDGPARSLGERPRRLRTARAPDVRLRRPAARRDVRYVVDEADGPQGPASRPRHGPSRDRPRRRVARGRSRPPWPR